MTRALKDLRKMNDLKSWGKTNRLLRVGAVGEGVLSTRTPNSCQA